MRTNKQNTTGDKHMNITNQATTTGDKHMNTNRQNATIVGILFILATVSAILGLYFYQPILSGADYLINGAAHKNEIALGALMELVLVVTAIGTAIALFPVLKPYGERIALGHLFFRFLEAAVILTGIVAILSLSTLSQAYVAADAADATTYHALGSLLHAVYKWTSMLGPLFFLGVNTLMYSYLLYKSKLVPRWLAVFGLFSATTVFAAALVVLSGIAIQLSTPVLLMVAPIGIFEMVFAGWLIVKGYNSSAIAPESARTETRTLLNAA
jgi:hypothetical protein